MVQGGYSGRYRSGLNYLSVFLSFLFQAVSEGHVDLRSVKIVDLKREYC